MKDVVLSQIRLPKPLHEDVRELAHHKRQSRNQFMVEGIRDKVEKEKLES